MNDVVTAVLLHGGKILILKRSDHVGTYRGAWACVSGYLERLESPFERAVTEIFEETGISRRKLTVKREAEPFDIDDTKIGMQWRIHPFLFETKTCDVTLDWEHTAFRWIAPEGLDAYDTVPRLKEVVFMLLQR